MLSSGWRLTKTRAVALLHFQQGFYYALTIKLYSHCDTTSERQSAWQSVLHRRQGIYHSLSKALFRSSMPSRCPSSAESCSTDVCSNRLAPEGTLVRMQGRDVAGSVAQLLQMRIAERIQI